MSRPKSNPLALQVYDTLLGEIASRQRTAGDRLVEADIARSAVVSRTPVREALGRLQSDGLIEPARPSGYVVVAPGMQDIRDIFEIRRALEPLAFASVVAATPRSEDAAFTALYEALQQADNARASAEANARLRAFWVDRIANTRLKELLLRFHLQVQIVRAATLDSTTGRAAARAGTTRLHAAWIARDTDAALQAMGDFVDAALSFFEQADAARSRK